MAKKMSRNVKRTFRIGSPIQKAYVALRKRGENAPPSRRMRAGFWVGTELFVATGAENKTPNKVYVEWWEKLKGGRGKAQKIVGILKRAKIDARIGVPFGR